MPARRRTSARRGPQARGARTRERILDAVLELVALRGPRAVTYRAVAERAGVAQGVMTYHFASRRELLSAAFERHLARVREAARDLPVADARSLSAKERERLVFGVLRSMVGPERTRHLAEFELTLELARDRRLRAEVAPESDTTRRFAGRLLERSGSAAPVEDAILISALMDGLALTWLARPDDPAFERQLRAAVRRLVALFFPAS